MMTATLQIQIDTVIRNTLDTVLRHGAPVLLVQAPPGAGKTWLIETLVATAVQVLKLRVAVVTPKTSQGLELVERLLANFDPMPLSLLQSDRNPLPERYARIPHFPKPISKAKSLPSGPGVVVGNVAKFRLAVPHLQASTFDLLICDEAYQVTAAEFGPLWHLARQTVLVGDPGQLRPIVEVETAFLEAGRFQVHKPVPVELCSRIPNVPVLKLPATRRLLQDTVDFIQPSLYPDLPFISATPNADRQLRFDLPGEGDAIDCALNLVAGGATIVALLLPATDGLPDELDTEVARLGAAVVRRTLDRQAHWLGERRLTPGDIGCIDSHVASGAALTQHLQLAGLSSEEVLVYPPEIWQGNERLLMVVKHPLSGKARLDSFSLEPGRLCVALSRHQIGCILVGRDGVGETLREHSINCGDRSPGSTHLEWNGWQAHQHLWERLEKMDRCVRI